MKHIKIKINENLADGDCGLWYDVLVFNELKNRYIHCVCPYTLCKSYEDAIEFYYKHYHKEEYKPLCVQHHKYSKQDLINLSQAA